MTIPVTGDSAFAEFLSRLVIGTDGTFRYGGAGLDGVQPATDTTPAVTTSPLRRYSDGSVRDVSGVSARSGGSGAPASQGSGIHDHQSDGGGSVLDVNQATRGVLQVLRGGTGLSGYSTGDLLVGNGNGGLDALAAGSGGQVLSVEAGRLRWTTLSAPFSSGNVLELGDARYVRSSGGAMTGGLTIGLASGAVGLNVLQAISGASLHAAKGLTSSGALVWEGAASGSSLYVASGLHGAGLSDCDLAASVLRWDEPTGRFLCGTIANEIGTAAFSGSVLQLGDARYLQTAGGTMTGTLVLEPASGVALNARGAISGRLITQNGAGNNYFLGNVGIGTSPSYTLHAAKQVNGGILAYLNNTSASGQATLALDSGNNGVTLLSLRRGGTEVGAITNASSSLNLSSGNAVVLRIGSTYVQYAKDGDWNELVSSSTQGLRFDLGGNNPLNLPAAGGVVFNEVGLATDVRAEGDTDANLLFLQGSTDRVGIGTASPKAKLDVAGTISGALVTQNGAGSNYFLGKLGVGTTEPDALLQLTASDGPSIRLEYNATTIPDGNSYGQIEWEGQDADNGASGVRARIAAFANGTQGGTQLIFSTANDGSASLPVHMLIHKNGYIGIGVPDTSVPETRLEVVGTVSGATVVGTNGIVTKVVPGACGDANAEATDGTLCVDSANGRIYFRYGAAWHYAAQTAGFQIPNLVWNGRNETEGLAPGDLVVGRLDQRLNDGALHGVWEKFDFDAQLRAALVRNPELLGSLGQGAAVASVSAGDLSDLLVRGALTVLGDATFFGDLDVRGYLSVGSQQAGEAAVAEGQTGVTIVFPQSWTATPLAQITPDWPVVAAVTDRSPAGFTIRLAEPSPRAVTFAWFAVASGQTSPMPPPASGSGEELAGPAPAPADAPQSGSGAALEDDVPAAIEFPVDERGYPVSTDPLWNACIRHEAVTHADGAPVDCGRVYLGDHRWEHPDLGVTFVFNDERSPVYLELPAGYSTVLASPSSSSHSSEAAGSGVILAPVPNETPTVEIPSGTGAAQ